MPSLARALLLLGFLLGACTPAARLGAEAEGCAKPCGGACCGARESCEQEACVACSPTTCEAAGRTCGPLPDGCGGLLSCGSCPAGQTCGGGGTEGVCGQGACVPTTCGQLRKDCGAVADGCGGTLQCGTCPQGQTCGGGGSANTCGTGSCTAESDRAFCQRLGKECGPVTDFDNCDTSRTVASCGNCPEPLSCGGGDRPNACGCTGEPDRDLCLVQGKLCGPVQLVDRCGVSRAVHCGTCNVGTCGGAGLPNRCGGLMPKASPTQEAIYSMWGSSDLDMWAVGAAGTGLQLSAGISWVRIPNFPTSNLFTSALLDVAGRGTGERWVVGAGGYRFQFLNGSYTADPHDPGRNDIFSLATLADSFWAQGRGGTFSTTSPSAVWTRRSTDTRFSAIWGDGEAALFACGNNGLFARWNGSGWSTVAGSATGSCNNMWGSSANDVWVVGAAGFVGHFDGTRWANVASPVSVDLFDVHLTGPDDVWVVGKAGTVLHWDGAGWTKLPQVTVNSVAVDLYTVWRGRLQLSVAGAGGNILWSPL